MTHKNRDFIEFDMTNHETNCLFTEWPTPAETVMGFGGDSAKAEDRQWKMKTDTKRSH
jgi:hypothetical protein